MRAGDQLAGSSRFTPPGSSVPRTCAISAPGSIPRSTQARLQHLRLTPAGSAAVERAIPALQRGEAEALAALSNAERATLAELLHKAARSRRS